MDRADTNMDTTADGQPLPTHKPKQEGSAALHSATTTKTQEKLAGGDQAKHTEEPAHVPAVDSSSTKQEGDQINVKIYYDGVFAFEVGVPKSCTVADVRTKISNYLAKKGAVVIKFHGPKVGAIDPDAEDENKLDVILGEGNRVDLKPEDKTAAVVRIGLPPLGDRRGSQTPSSVSRDHADATIKNGDFKTIPGVQAPPVLTTIWSHYDDKGMATWASESDVQSFVKLAITGAIKAAHLEDVLCCLNELSVFEVRPDIWIVKSKLGVPVGVVEVKTPTEVDVCTSEKVAGQLFDYMLRLKSFHGLQHVFGILTTYSEWRIFWLDDDSKVAAAADKLPDALNQDVRNIDATEGEDGELECMDANIQRTLCGGPVMKHDSPILIPALMSVLQKMNSVPISPVEDISSSRYYIVIDKEKWVWKKIQWKKKVLNYHKMPTAETLILIRDLRGGADGRVWQACSTSGLVCTLKFAHFLEHIPDKHPIYVLREAKERLAHEVEMHKKQGVAAELITLCSRPVMKMPYFRPFDLEHLSGEEKQKVKDSVTELATRCKVYHGDISDRHILRETPTKQYKFIDMTRARVIEDSEDANKLASEMVSKLNF